MIQRYAFTSLFSLLIIAFTVSTAAAESYTYRSGGGITTLRGLPLDLSHFNTRANGYIPHEGGNDFIIMEQFDKNCGPNSAQMVLYYYRNHKRLKEVWALGDIHTVELGTWPDELRQVLNESDIPAHWYSERTLDDVRRYIRNNRPPILLLRLSNLGYHWVVAVGYDTRYNEILVADPNGRFKWWSAEELLASWSLAWQADYAEKGREWYEFQFDVGLFDDFHLAPYTMIVPLDAPSFETNYHAYWSDMQGIEISGEDTFLGKTHGWEKQLTFSNPLDIVQVSDIELVSSTGTAQLNGWERVGDRKIKLWGQIEDGLVLRGRMWVVVRTFYLDDSAAAPSGQPMLQSGSPIETSLLPNYPNPFNPETWIPYQLASPAEVSVSIYAADGKLVRRLALGRMPAGIYHGKARAAYWDGENFQGEPVASGLYFYTLKAGDFSATKKMLIRK